MTRKRKAREETKEFEGLIVPAGEYSSMEELLDAAGPGDDYLTFLDQLEELPVEVRHQLSEELIKLGYEDPKRTCAILGKGLATEMRNLYRRFGAEYGDGYSLLSLYQLLSIKPDALQE